MALHPGPRPWAVLDRREVFSAPPWLRVFSQEMRLPDGTVIPDFYLVEAPPFAVSCVRRPGGEVLLLRQWKPAAGKVVHCLPGGFLEEGEEPLAGAMRELREEAGISCASWTHLLSLPVSADRGYGTGHFFLGEGAREEHAPSPGAGEESEPLWLPPERALRLLAEGEPFTLSAVAVLLLATHPGLPWKDGAP